MIFGDKSVFAIEAIIEPGSELPPQVYGRVAGRVRVFFQNLEVGNFHEPCCVLGPIAEHFAEVGAYNRIWHSSLASLGTKEQFDYLDHMFYVGPYVSSEARESLNNCTFLTNVSEAFEHIKGFVLRADSESFQFLFTLPKSESVHSFVVSFDQFLHAANGFSTWLHEQQQLIGS